MRASVRRFLRGSEQITRAHGLTLERYELLLAIKAQLLGAGGRGPTMAELADILELAESSTTQLARRAENNGLVERQVAPHDARVRYLQLTAEGERRLAAAIKALRRERTQLADTSSRIVN